MCWRRQHGVKAADQLDVILIMCDYRTESGGNALAGVMISSSIACRNMGGQCLKSFGPKSIVSRADQDNAVKQSQQDSDE